MTSLLDVLAFGISVAGVICLVTSSVVGVWRDGLRMALTLWTAAGLLRLTGPDSWDRAAASAVILVVRQLVSVGLRRMPTVETGRSTRATPRR